MSIGEERVRIRASDPQQVIYIKQRVAECIDWCEALKRDPALPLDHHRLIAEAQRAFEVAGMFAVKAATML